MIINLRHKSVNSLYSDGSTVHPRSFHSKASKSTHSIISFPASVGLWLDRQLQPIYILNYLKLVYQSCMENTRSARQQRAANRCRSAIVRCWYRTRTSRCWALARDKQPCRASCRARTTSCRCVCANYDKHVAPIDLLREMCIFVLVKFCEGSGAHGHVIIAAVRRVTSRLHTWHDTEKNLF